MVSLIGANNNKRVQVNIPNIPTLTLVRNLFLTFIINSNLKVRIIAYKILSADIFYLQNLQKILFGTISFLIILKYKKCNGL